jgi:pyruvate dehydrogenase E2 component (dihydrolipoamide acetyltransferase)
MTRDKYRYENIAATPYAKLLSGQYGISLSAVTAQSADGVIRASDVTRAAETGAAAGGSRTASQPRMTPLARRMAEAKGIDPGALHGSGHSGKIFAADLRDAPQAGAPGADDEVTVINMNGVRRTIARRMSQSASETATVTQFMDMDATDMLELRRILNEGAAAGERITVTSFLVKAIATATREHERFRMQISEGADAFLLHRAVNVGIAVGMDEGLLVPVMHDADQKTLRVINAEVASLSRRAKDGSLFPHNYEGGVITLSNMGMYGVTAFTPIINQPEASILGVGAPMPRLTLTQQGVVVRSYITQSLTYDHRIINGTEAALFQQRVKELIENPEELTGPAPAAGSQQE